MLPITLLLNSALQTEVYEHVGVCVDAVLTTPCLLNCEANIPKMPAAMNWNKTLNTEFNHGAIKSVVGK